KKLTHPIWHRSQISLHQMMNKMNQYTDLQAQEMVRNKRHFNAIRMLLEIPLTFLKYYFLRRYYKLGRMGLHDSIFWAFARFMKQAKTWELHQKSQKK
ncbi:MAG: glycosyltransferase family 2 protein, partial [Alphaproteobacteria bacterium]|nr:glycosyltransferase family 2 protein [Alphaproteobacteria bacterium]